MRVGWVGLRVAGGEFVGAVWRRKAASHSNRLVGARLQRQGYSEAERSRGLEVDHQFEFGRLLDRRIGWLFALDNAASVDVGLPKRIGSVGTVAHESAGCHELASNIRHGNSVASRQRHKLSAPIIQKWIGWRR